MPNILPRSPPIDDVRASGDYRLDAALTLAKRVLSQLGAQT